MRHWWLPLLALLPLEARAQTVPAEQDSGIVVLGSREAPSDWREAETDHVVVLSDGNERELVRIARNLERLHFLLSVLLGRIDKPDETVKLRVTLVGDSAEFDAMDLRNLRSKPGPFAAAFPVTRYYDPREDGAILASTRIDQNALLGDGVSMASLGSLLAATVPATPTGQGGGGVPSAAALSQATSFGSNDPLAVSINTVKVPLPAEGRIYAGYAQHFLLTYFPAAYPRWYVDGFGELFSTLVAREDGVLEYGRAPEGIRRVLDRYPGVRIADVLTGKALTDKGFAARWTPFHAWALTHMLFVNDERRGQLRAYLRAIAGGTPPEQAVQAFGDLGELQRAFVRYGERKVWYDRLTYPADRVAEPIVHQLTKGQAAFLKGRLELGSRVELPEAAAPGTDPKRAAEIERARRRAIAARDDWLADLRKDAARYPTNVEAQLLLAEAECRSDDSAQCLTAADRALALAPGHVDALTWKGVALTQQAIAGPTVDRKARLKAARALIARANRTDTENLLPLLAYYRSFADAGETPPDLAVEGLEKVVETVPAAPGPRLLLAEALAQRGNADAARKALRPVVAGAYDSPERTKAAAIVAMLPAN
jgi:cytochrome c-type biogenesis protein CcmH/NrfG